MSIVDKIDALGIGNKSHAAGAFPSHILRRLEQLMPAKMKATAETGCGKSTILFSNLASSHTVFCIDDTKEKENSSITFFKECPLTRLKAVEMVLGPTQLTLPKYKKFKSYDAVLIDGPHGFPFPELEYYHFYPRLNPGAVLIVDDVHIASIGRLADFINEDPMFELVELVSTTAVFRRTNAPTFNPLGDGWWEQDFNRRRIPAGNEYLKPYRLADGKIKQSFASMLSMEVTASDPRPAPVSQPKQKSFLERLLGN
jgi:Methyltransferase domain